MSNTLFFTTSNVELKPNFLNRRIVKVCWKNPQMTPLQHKVIKSFIFIILITFRVCKKLFYKFEN